MMDRVIIKIGGGGFIPASGQPLPGSLLRHQENVRYLLQGNIREVLSLSLPLRILYSVLPRHDIFRKLLAAQ
jgi:hypothetical protein